MADKSTCPVCGTKDAFEGEICRVCGHMRKFNTTAESEQKYQQTVEQERKLYLQKKEQDSEKNKIDKIKAKIRAIDEKIDRLINEPLEKWPGTDWVLTDRPEIVFHTDPSMDKPFRMIACAYDMLMLEQSMGEKSVVLKNACGKIYDFMKKYRYLDEESAKYFILAGTNPKRMKMWEKCLNNIKSMETLLKNIDCPQLKKDLSTMYEAVSKVEMRTWSDMGIENPPFDFVPVDLADADEKDIKKSEYSSRAKEIGSVALRVKYMSANGTVMERSAEICKKPTAEVQWLDKNFSIDENAPKITLAFDIVIDGAKTKIVRSMDNVFKKERAMFLRIGVKKTDTELVAVLKCFSTHEMKLLDLLEASK